MADTLRTLDFRASKKGLKLAYRVAPSLPDRLLTDPDRLRQVLVNLIGNAIKFTETGEVVVEVVPGDETAGDNADNQVAIRFEVRDSGIGMPADKLETIFKPFQPGRRFDHTSFRRHRARSLDLETTRRTPRREDRSEQSGGDR